MNKKTMEKIVNILLNIFIVIFSIVLLISLYNTIQIKVFKNKYSNFFGYSVFEIQTNSMADEIMTDDWIIVKLTKKVNVNDIITYEQDGKFITHRVIEKYKDTYITRGDANNSPDEPIDSSQIVGKVDKVLGKVGIYRKTLFDKQVLLALIALLVIISLLFKKGKKDDDKHEEIEKDKEEINAEIREEKLETTGVYSFYDENDKRTNIFKRKKKVESDEKTNSIMDIKKENIFDKKEINENDELIDIEENIEIPFKQEKEEIDKAIISVELDDENIEMFSRHREEEVVDLKINNQINEDAIKVVEDEEINQSEIVGFELGKLDDIANYEQEKYFEAINNLNQINEIEESLKHNQTNNINKESKDDEVGIISVSFDDDYSQEEATNVEESANNDTVNKKIEDPTLISIEVNSLDDENDSDEEIPSDIDSKYTFDENNYETISIGENEIEATKREIEMYKQKALAASEQKEREEMAIKQEKINKEKDEEEKAKLEAKEIEESKKLTHITLEKLSKKKKKSKNIIDKIMFTKSQKIEELIFILTDNKEVESNEPTIRESLIECYNNALYYNHFDTDTKKIDFALKDCAIKLIKSYKGSDKKYEEKVNKNLEHILLISKLETTNLSKKTTKERNEFYKEEVIKYSKDKEWTREKVIYVFKEIKNTQRKYLDVIEYILKNLETDTFKLEFNQLQSNKNMYGISMSHNVAFDKFYSEFVIDETYKTGIIAENKMNVLINLVLNEIVKDMLLGTFNKKYLLYFPQSLYAKTTKIKSMFKIFDDLYAKENIYIIMNYETFVKSKKLIKESRKQGYLFGVILSKEDEIKEKDEKFFGHADIIFIDKNEKSEIIKSIPNDYYERVILEDITKKLDDYEGRGD